MAGTTTSAGRGPIGTGMRSPFAFSLGRGVRSVSTVDGIEKIQASIRDILMTRIGERLNQPEYGSRVFDLVFEPNDPITHRLLHIYVSDALRRWERRISVDSTDFVVDPSDDHRILIVVNFTVLATHQQGSYVFPFTRGPMPMESAVQGTEAAGLSVRGTVVPPLPAAYGTVGLRG